MKKKQKRNSFLRFLKHLFQLIFCLVLVFVLAGVIIYALREPASEILSGISSSDAGNTGDSSADENLQGDVVISSSSDAGTAVSEAVTETESENTPAGQDAAANADFASLEETDIYTFLQGPQSWKRRIDWSGSWCNQILADEYFGAFGCGHCDMANIYSTLTPYDCSPIDMYHYAKEVTEYAPYDGIGAIDWAYMKQTLRECGIYSIVRRKDYTYDSFRDWIAGSVSAIVLIDSENDDSYWQNTDGHYVNIWLYRPEDETIFLADSGNPDHNRQRIPLRTIYNSLSWSSDYQYMVINKVDPDANSWQHDGISLKWKKPSYYKGTSK